MSHTRWSTYGLMLLTLVVGACSSDSSDTTAGGETDACASSGEYSFVCGVQNAEDLVLLPDTNWVIASSMVPGAPIYLIDADTREASALFPGAGASIEFDSNTYQTCPGEPDMSNLFTHGLHLRQSGDGSSTLYAVTHGEDRETIEVFDIDISGASPTLTWVGCVFLPEGLDANSVTSFEDGTIFATVLIHPEFTFEDAMAGQPTGALYEWSPTNGGDFTLIEGTEISSSNGIEVSADGAVLFTASSGLQTVVAFDRSNPSRQLRTTATLPIIPDNVHMAANGRLITAGTITDEPDCGGMPAPSEFDIEAYAQCPRGFMALSIDPETMEYTTIAQGSANAAFSNATMALEVGDEVWVGTFAGDRIGIVSGD